MKCNVASDVFAVLIVIPAFLKFISELEKPHDVRGIFSSQVPRILDRPEPLEHEGSLTEVGILMCPENISA